MKQAAWKDFYREIKKSRGRFLSLLFIVALGVAFLAGIRSSEPSMRITGDTYFDQAKLMDIKVISTLGLTDADVESMAQVEGVARAVGTYSQDLISVGEENQNVLHVMAQVPDMNEPTLSDGRLPEAVGECLADQELAYQVGDVITLDTGTDEAVTDTMETDTLTVVGVGSSPCYISFARGSTNIGTGSIDGFLIVPQDTFDRDVYTEIDVEVSGAAALTAYTDDYDACVQDVMDGLEAIADERCEIRRRDVVAEANQAIEDAKKDLADAREETDEQLAQAEKELQDAEEELAQGKAEIQDGKQQIQAAKKELNDSQAQVDAGWNDYQAGLSEYEDGLADYEAGEAAYQSAKKEYDAQTADAKGKLSAAEQELETAQQQISQLSALADSMQSLTDQIASVQSQLDAAKSDPDTDEETIESLTHQLASLQGQLSALEASAGSLSTVQSSLSAARKAYDAGAQEVAAARQGLEDGEAELASARQELDTAKAQLDAAKRELSDAKSRLNEGQKQIDAGWLKLTAQETQLTQAEAEITQGEQELSDGWDAYEENRAEAEKALSDAQKEIEEAEDEVAQIAAATWYVYDRNTLPEYTGYGENADRMRAIGEVFPVIFFLVAALMSLTSMTRMVEEERTQIGTMKALGYSRAAIAGKYLGYALLATLGGCIIGFLLGEKILPYIIIYAYGMMYPGVGPILVPYHIGYGLIASGAALVCTLGATWYACYAQLRAQPATLMRPPTPANGKRVFLERIKPVWNALNFSWKSSVRNLLRYKKRFLMTVLGIGGCMGLMVVGFGLRDSIYDVAQLQYKDIQIYQGLVYQTEDASEAEKEALTTFLEADPDVVDFMDGYMKTLTLTSGKKEQEATLHVLFDTETVPDYVHFRDRKSGQVYTLDDEGALISEKTAKLLGVDVGDVISIKDEERGNLSVRIAGIFENYMSHYLYMTPAYYEEIYGEPPQANSLAFRTPDTYTKEEVEAAGAHILSQEAALNVTYMHDIQKELDDMLTSLNLVIIVLIISAGMLAFVVLYNLNSINITERQRELATLKVLGFSDREVAVYVYRENVILTFLGAIFGVALGRVLHLFVIQTVEVDAVMFGRVVYLSSYLYSLLFTLFFAVIVNGVMYFKLQKIDMVASLKSVE